MPLPVWIIVLLCSGLPLAWLVWQIVTNPTVLVEAWPDAFRMKLLGRTLFYNGIVAVLATLMGLPVGIVLGRGRGVIAKLLWTALPISLLLPSVTYAYGWAQFFRMMGATMEPAGCADVMRCILSLATWLWAIPATAVGIALRRLDTQVQQQALLDGALWRVTFRALAGAVASATVICAVLAVQEFAVYEPTGISVIATEVRMVFETGAFSSSDNPITAPMGTGGPADESSGLADQRARAAAAVATSIPLLVVIALLIAPILWMARGVSAQEEIEVGPWPRALDAGKAVTLLSVIVVVIAVVVPMLSLVASLKVHRDPRMIWNEFSPQVTGALRIAGMSGLVALGMAAWSAVRRVPGVIWIALVTFLIGGQLIAIAQIRLYNHAGLGWVYNAPPIMVMAYLSRFGWIALVAGRSTWSPHWQTLRDLSAVDGTGPVRTAASVLWPLAWPLLLAAGVLVMALSLTEVPATLLISPQRPPMLTPMLMTWVHLLRYDAMIEASLLLMFMVAVLGFAVAGLLAMSRKWSGFDWRTRVRTLRPPKRGFEVIQPLLLLAAFMLTGCDNSKPVAIWCETGTGPAQVVYPRAIAYKPQDNTFFVIDRLARIQHLDDQGQCINEWRMPKWQQGKPVGVSIGPDGNVYVPDTHYHEIKVYSPDGQLLRQWGGFGHEPGQFIYPTDIAFDAKGNVFVSEYGDNDRIQIFTPQGEFLYAFGQFGTGDGEFMRPQSILIDGDMLYVADSCNHRLLVFKTDGTFVRAMGGTGSGLGQFRYPYGLAEDREGNLIVCEFGNNRVQMIDKATGRGIKAWGSGGHDPGQLAYPWGVVVDKHDRVVAVDAGNNRLQVFEF